MCLVLFTGITEPYCKRIIIRYLRQCSVTLVLLPRFVIHNCFAKVCPGLCELGLEFG